MPFLLLLFLPFGVISAQQIKSIHSDVQNLHKTFTVLSSEAYTLLPYTQGAVKNSTYSFDGTDGRTGLSLNILYRFKINGISFTNVLAYAPDEANYYLTYINGLQYFQDSGALSYKVIPIRTAPKAYLWHTKEKTAVLVPAVRDNQSYGFFLKIHFPKDITNEAVVVGDIASKINWAALEKLFTP